MFAGWKQVTPAGRLGRPEELAATIAFLASDRAGFITGQAVLADGGPRRAVVESHLRHTRQQQAARGRAGEGGQGPDLGQPMNPVDYFRPDALRRLLRDPESVRSWPDRKMPAFTPDMLPDTDLDAILAWLAYKARAPR